MHALRGVSFTIREGEFVTIMGTSGSGKSTLLNTLGCLDTPTSGEYLLDGISVRTMSKPQRAVLRNRKIGFVFQSYNLLPKTTAVENVELPLMYNSSVSASERRRRAIEALQAVGLGDRLEHKSNQMSGGQMQRVAIARALVNNPPLSWQTKLRVTWTPVLLSRFWYCSKAACRRTHHHLRHPQPRNSPVQQPQHRAARRTNQGRHHQHPNPECSRSPGSIA